MPEERIRQLLQELHLELERSGETDPVTLKLVRDLDEQIHRHVDPELPDEEESIADLATELQTRFATDHPVAEGVLRNIVDALGNMGI